MGDQDVEVRREIQLAVAAAGAGGGLRSQPELQELRNIVAISVN